MLSLNSQRWVHSLLLASYTAWKLRNCKVERAIPQIDACCLYVTYKERIPSTISYRQTGSYPYIHVHRVKWKTNHELIFSYEGAVVFLSEASAELLLPAASALFLLHPFSELSYLFVPLARTTAYLSTFLPESDAGFFTAAKIAPYANATKPNWSYFKAVI